MKILFIGIGSIAKKHIAALQYLGVECDISALRSSRDSKDYEGISNIYSYDDIVNNNFDFAIISNPTSKHEETIRRLLEYHLPLFIEKPLFSSIDNNEDLVIEATKCRIPTYVACDMRFMDCLIYLHDYIASHSERNVNEVNVYCGSYLPEWRPGTDFRKCYSAIPELGGGVHLDLIHDLDYVYWIFGNPEKSRAIWRNNSTLDIRSIDYANYNLIYPNFCVNIILNYYRRDYKRTMEIVFDDGTWIVDMAKNVITDEKCNVIFQSHQSWLDEFASQMQYFLNLTQGKIEHPINNINEAYNVLKICFNHENISNRSRLNG